MSAGFTLPRDRALIDALAQALAVPLSRDAADAWARYAALVATWNQKLDLTAARDARAQVEVLLADSLVLCDPTLVPQGSRIIDVGSGAGAPVLPVVLARGDLHATLVEPLRKRVAFLRTAIGSLGLPTRATVLEQKLDPDATMPNVNGTPFDVALSRATFAPELWLSAGAKLAQRTLVLLAAQEPPTAPANVTLVARVPYRLPWLGSERSIAIYDRTD